MDHQAKLYCRDSLRDARAAALRDVEGFTEILFAVERLGSLVTGRIGTLRDFQPSLCELASVSPLGSSYAEAHPHYQIPFTRLYATVQRARNDALHQGAFARHLTSHCVELALVLEDALTQDATQISDYMIKTPLCAQLWQPLGFVRQQMLANSFSFLPVRSEGGAWSLVSDFALARILRGADSRNERNRRMAVSLAEARDTLHLKLQPATTVLASAGLSDVLDQCDGFPVLVVGDSGDLLGLVTPYDLL